MECEKVQALLPDSSVGLLDAQAQVRLEKHLAGCAICRREKARLEGVMALVEQLPAKEPPYGLWYGIEARITRQPERVAPWSWGWMRRRMALGLAAAALLIGLAFAGMHRPSDQAETLQAEAAHTRVIQFATVGPDQPFADRVSMDSLVGLANYEESDGE